MRELFAGFCAVAAAISVASAYAAGSPEAAAAGDVVWKATSQDRLHGVMFQGDQGVAVGSRGRILRSKDGGQSWAADTAATELALSNVTSDGNHEIAVGQLGVILVRTGGAEWQRVESGTHARLLNVDLNRRGLAVAVGAFGALLRSVDAGRTWTSIAPDWAQLYDSGSGDTAVLRDEPTNYLVKVLEDDRIIIGGEYGQLMESTDRGESWRVLYRHRVDAGETAPTLFDIKLEGRRGFAAGQAGLILRTDDGGYCWTVLPSGTRASLFAIDMLDEQRVVAVGQRAAVSSTDGGGSWSLINDEDLSLNWYAGLAHGRSATGRVIAVGHSGRILSMSPFRP